MNVSSIDYNYKFLKMKFGNVNDGIYELLNEKIPHICYPFEIKNRDYFLAEYLILKLKV